MKLATIVTSLLVPAALAGCVESNPSGLVIPVSSTTEACILAEPAAPAGTVTFRVTNDGSQETEFYLLTEDGGVVAEVEHIGPGLTRDMTVAVDPGTYVTACKPGMTGEGIRSDFLVTEPESQ